MSSKRNRIPVCTCTRLCARMCVRVCTFVCMHARVRVRVSVCVFSNHPSLFSRQILSKHFKTWLACFTRHWNQIKRMVHSAGTNTHVIYKYRYARVCVCVFGCWLTCLYVCSRHPRYVCVCVCARARTCVTMCCCWPLSLPIDANVERFLAN